MFVSNSTAAWYMLQHRPVEMLGIHRGKGKICHGRENLSERRKWLLCRVSGETQGGPGLRKKRRGVPGRGAAPGKQVGARECATVAQQRSVPPSPSCPGPAETEGPFPTPHSFRAPHTASGGPWHTGGWPLGQGHWEHKTLRLTMPHIPRLESGQSLHLML